MISGLRAIRGPLLNPSPTAGVDYFADGVLVGDDRGRIVAVGAWDEVSARLNLDVAAVPRSEGLIVPPLLDAHIHIPQHPIRGRFAENIGADPPGGRLLASLEQNVFPAEVEDLISGHPDVVEATAIGVDDSDFGARLRAFVVLRDGAATTEDAIKEYVREHLARYKVPREVVFLTELPRNPTGKILKRELRQIEIH